MSHAYAAASRSLDADASSVVRIEIFRASASRRGVVCRLRRRELELLVALATCGEIVGRDAFLELLWPGVARTHASAALRTTIHRLRQSLGVADVVVNESGYRLGEGVCVDIHEAERALRIVGAAFDAEPSAQTQLRDLFRAFDVDLPHIYDGWPWFERVRPALLDVRRRVGIRLAQMNFGLRRFAESVDIAERLLHHDASDEPALELLVRALIADGRALEARHCVRRYTGPVSPELRLLVECR